MEDEIREIFSNITETYVEPIKLGSNCESNIYYRVEDLRVKDLALCASYLKERILDNCASTRPEILVSMKTNFTELADKLAEELALDGKALEVVDLEKVEQGNGVRNVLRGKSVVLINDVITTGKTCLEAHNNTTLMGGIVHCWAALIDRTFGPGPVPVAACFTGSPITLVSRY